MSNIDSAAEPTAPSVLSRSERHAVYGIVVIVGTWAAIVRPELRADMPFLGIFAFVLCAQFAASRARVFGIVQRIKAPPLELLTSIGGTTLLIAFAGPTFGILVHLFVVPVLIAANQRHWFGSVVVGCAALVCATYVFVSSAADPFTAATATQIAGSAALFAIVSMLARSLVGEIDAAERRAEVLISHDQLTSLRNLRGFVTDAEKAHQEAIVDRRPHAILMINIAGLKLINDEYGHDAGNRAIALVGGTVLRLTADRELVGRYAADKFLVFLPTIEHGRAEQLARRLRNVVSATTMNVGAYVVRNSVNVGIAKYPVDGVTLQALMSAAETDMHIDKKGRMPKGKMPIFRRRPGTAAG